MRSARIFAMIVVLCLAVSGIASASSINNTSGQKGTSASGSATLHPASGGIATGAGKPIGGNPLGYVNWAVDFPTYNDFMCGSNYCGYMGSESDFMWTPGNFIETVPGVGRGITSLTDLSAQVWSFQNYLDYGQYETYNVYVWGNQGSGFGWNQVADFSIDGCGECGSTGYVYGTVEFPGIAPDPSYDNNFFVYFAQTSYQIPPYEGSVGWYAGYGNTGLSGSTIPEPATLMLFGSGLLGLGGVIRRRLGKQSLGSAAL
ncbi:MAG: PEP-CTERM sorting domain-containing protein [Terriglobia bacterium]|jgi:hypothetical protein